MSETQNSRAPRALAAGMALALGATAAVTAGSVAVADDAAASTVTVRSGDGWWAVSQRAGVSQTALASFNGMTVRTLLHPGMVLKTTGSSSAPRPAASGTVTVRSGEGWIAVARRAGVSAGTLASLNGMTVRTMLHPGQTLKTSGTTPVVRASNPAPAPAPAPSSRQSVANAAAALANSPHTRYVWGGNGPYAFDCSGLTKWVYAKAGVSIPRTATAQYQAARKVPLSQARPGDLIFWGGSNGRMYHTGVYLGNNKIAHALNPSDGVIITGMIMKGDMMGVVGRF